MKFVNYEIIDNLKQLEKNTTINEKEYLFINLLRGIKKDYVILQDKKDEVIFINFKLINNILKEDNEGIFESFQNYKIMFVKDIKRNKITGINLLFINQMVLIPVK